MKARAFGLALAVAVCGAYLAAAYPNILFGGETLVASANAHPFDDRLTRLRPGGRSFRAALNWHDIGATWWQWEPAGEYFARAYRSGQVPLWDRTAAGGVDAHVNITQGQYFPPYVLLLLAGNTPPLRDAYYLALLGLAGACSFVLLHRHGLHPLACAAAATYMLAGTMTLTANSIMGQTAAMLPVIVLAMDRYLAAPSPRRAAIVAAAVTCAVTASFMPIVISGLLLLSIQLAVHAASGALHGKRWRRRLLEAGAGAAAMALGLAAAAFLLLPVYLFSRSDPVFRAWYADSATAVFAPELWPQLLSRVVPYSVTQGWSPYRPHRPYVVPVNVFDVGVVPVFAALLASFSGRRRSRRLLVALTAATGIILAKMFGVPPVQWLEYVPVLKEIHWIPYAGAAFGLGVAVLAGQGVDALVRARPSLLRAVLVTIICLGLAAFAVVFAQTHVMTAGAGLRDPVVEAGRLAAWTAAALAAVWLRVGGVLGGPASGALLLAALLAELVPLAHTPRFQRAPVWTDVPRYVQFLQRDTGRFRIHSTDPLAVPPNVNQALGLEHIGSRHPFNAPRYNRLVKRYFATQTTVYPAVTALLPTRRVLLDLLGVRYVVIYKPTDAELSALANQRLDVALRDERYVVLRNRSSWPRSYVASAVLVAPGLDAALDAVATLPPRGVVIEERPAAAEVGPVTSGGECHIRDYMPGRVRIEAFVARPAIVVFGEAHDRGWTATVNGQPAPILHANVAFRAVEVPAGRSQVEFNYRTPGLDAGLTISALALGLIAGLAAWPLVGKARRADALRDTRR